MLYAINQDNNILEAIPKTRALCPCCKNEVLSKCGEYKIWHWAHLNNEDCDTWSEGETVWHKEWKNYWPIQNREVVIGKHRADVKTEKGIVLEFQHSSISTENLRKRENFYNKMVWVFDVRSDYKPSFISTNSWLDEDDTNTQKLSLFKKEGNKGVYYTFFWKYAKRYMLDTTMPAFLDLGDALFLVKKYHYQKGKTGIRGWGIKITKEQFIKMFS